MPETSAGITKEDLIKNYEMRRRTEIEESLAENVDRRVLRWFGHVER